VSVEHCRQAPPKLYDLPALQKTCAQKWSWTADRTLAIAQELYDGNGKKLITYPRAEARHLTENQIADVPGICGAGWHTVKPRNLDVF
jgi:DNA topoisomerase III